MKLTESGLDKMAFYFWNREELIMQYTVERIPFLSASLVIINGYHEKTGKLISLKGGANLRQAETTFLK
jgi:hypothetical protein